MTSSQPHNWR